MPYVDKDGVLVQKTPFSIYGLFWTVVNFFYLWYKTLIDADFNKYGDKYTSRTLSKPGGGGPPRPPSRKMGGFNTGSSPGSSPAGGGGCGCGG